ncbi:hypothetical protein PALU110988_09385 [Paenibacillus lupini]|nr:hypothetical protein [Paenibacillus lupini]
MISLDPSFFCLFLSFRCRLGWMRIKVPARKRSIYKAELLISMEEMDPEFSLTVEGLVAILIIDMVNESRKGYNNKYVQRLIGQLREAR